MHLELQCQTWSMRFNTIKREVMMTQRGLKMLNRMFTFNNQELKDVNQAKHFGFIITNN